MTRLIDNAAGFACITAVCAMCLDQANNALRDNPGWFGAYIAFSFATVAIVASRSIWRDRIR